MMKAWDVLLPILLFFCGYWTLHQLPAANEDPLKCLNNRSAPLLEKLVQTKFFRIVRMNINDDCQLGVMRRICQSRSCTVCRCESGLIPEHWESTEKVHTHVEHQDMWENERLQSQSGWVWHVEDEANDRGEYFDVHTNI